MGGGSATQKFLCQKRPDQISPKNQKKILLPIAKTPRTGGEHKQSIGGVVMKSFRSPPPPHPSNTQIG